MGLAMLEVFGAKTGLDFDKIFSSAQILLDKYEGLSAEKVADL